MTNKISHYFILGGVIGIGIFLRLWEIGAESLRLDEAQSIWQAAHTTEFIRFYMLKNVHLPLHNTLLHFWIILFGSSETTVRIFSAIFGILSLPAFYLLSRQILKKKWALAATAIGAISPFWIWYSREIRMYTLLTLITILSYYFFIKIIRKNELKYYVLYTLVNLAGIFTHYFFFLVLMAQAVFFFSTWKISWNSKTIIRKKEIFQKLLAVAAILLIIFSPWVYGFLKTYGSGTLAPELKKPTSFNIVLSFFEFTFGYQPEKVTTALIALWPLVVLIGFIFLAKRNPIQPIILLLIIGIILPVFFTFMVSIFYRPVYLTRYLIIITPLYYILVAWVLSESKGLFQKVFLTLLAIGLSATFINQYLSRDIAVKENYREAAIYISNQTTPRDIIALAPPYLIYPFQYYYRGPAQLVSLPIWDKRKGAIPEISPERLAEDTQTIKSSHSRIFLFIADNLEGSLEVKEYLDNKFAKLEKKQFSKTLWVNVYQAEYTPPPKLYAYNVKNGDTLSSIAYEFYKNALLYRTIAEVNNLDDPHFIEVGRSLRIPAIP